MDLLIHIQTWSSFIDIGKGQGLKSIDKKDGHVKKISTSDNMESLWRVPVTAIDWEKSPVHILRVSNLSFDDVAEALVRKHGFEKKCIEALVL